MFKNLKFNKNYRYLFLSFPIIYFFLVDYKGERDIWFLLSHGRYVLSNELPYVDILSMHKGFSFVMQQWLSSVIFYSIYNYLGSFCFYIFMFILNCIFVFCVYKLSYIISNRKFTSVIIACITTLLMQIQFIVPRPQIFTFIILLILLYILELYSSKRKKKILLFILLLSLLLVNLHASMWPMIIIFSMSYVAEYFIEFIKNKDLSVFYLVGILLLSILVGLINPYGIDACLYSVKSYGIDYICDIVGEMHGFNLLGGPYQKFFSYFCLLIFLFSNLIILCNSNKKNFRVSHLLLFYGTFFMALTSIRNIALFIIGTVPFLSKYFLCKDSEEFVLNKNWKICYSLLFIFFVLCFVSGIVTKKFEFYNPNLDVVNYMIENNISKDIKLYTGYSDGSTYEYAGYKPYVDARAEVFVKKMNHKKDILKEYVLFNTDKKFIDKFIEEYDFDYYVIDRFSKKNIKYMLNKSKYDFEVVYKNKDVTLLKRVR